MGCHLVEDLAASLGLTVKARLPKLCPSTDLIEKTRADYGLHSKAIKGVYSLELIQVLTGL